MWLPIDGDKFVTMQWDSTDISRSMTPIQIEGVKRSYEDLGYEVVTVGGQAKVPDLKNSLKHIGFAMYHAKYHVGVDSGMMHIAQFYKKYEDIHIHNYGFTSHHLVRAKKNGTKINYMPKD
jgi:ADP-heptose:LPS heptosyltransferase